MKQLLWKAFLFEVQSERTDTLTQVLNLNDPLHVLALAKPVNDLGLKVAHFHFLIGILFYVINRFLE